MEPGQALTWSTEALIAASIMGVLVAGMRGVLRPGQGMWWGGLLHGSLGLAGFALLLLGLGGPPRGVEQGAGSFGVVAAVFVGAALAMGLLIAAGQLRKRQPSILVIGLHATLAVFGLVVLVAYLSV